MLLLNDGNGVFTDASDQLPSFSNNYDFDALDINGDGFLDLATINDGAGLTEHLLLGNGSGGFDDATEMLWPARYNVGADDNVARFVDLTGDGISDLFIGSLSGADRWLPLNPQGEVQGLSTISVGPNTPGTLDVALRTSMETDVSTWSSPGRGWSRATGCSTGRRFPPMCIRLRSQRSCPFGRGIHFSASG